MQGDTVVSPANTQPEKGSKKSSKKAEGATPKKRKAGGSTKSSKKSEEEDRDISGLVEIEDVDGNVLIPRGVC